MARDDWFRRTSWSERDRREFFERLARSRTDYNKSQYLRLQALALQDTQRRPLVRRALELLELLVAEYAHPSQLASAHLQRARCLEFLDDLDAALPAYREAFAAMRLDTNYRPLAHLDFAWAVVTGERADLIDEALAALKEFTSQSELLFPANAYRYFAATAFGSAWSGDETGASRFAHRALEASKQDRNLLRRNKRLGLVQDRGGRVFLELQRLATGWEGDDLYPARGDT